MCVRQRESERETEQPREEERKKKDKQFKKSGKYEHMNCWLLVGGFGREVSYRLACQISR